MKKKALFIKVSCMLAIFYGALLFFLFIPAGSIKFSGGWVFFGIFFIWTNILTFYFLAKNPTLIERRTHSEEGVEQKIIQSLNALMMVALLVIAGIDFRYTLTKIPVWLQVLSVIIVSAGFLIVFFVFKQNSYLASNIKSFENQKTITTGLYSVVRHPMYSGVYLIILFSPFILSSLWALIPSVIVCILIVFRTINEEKKLLQDLPDYKKYCENVHYRFCPFVY
jgi:protein-S-isoprenylcysteine O-methyltransferase Ste14